MTSENTATSEDGATVVHEWRVTGEPDGKHYPKYDFTYRSDRAEWSGWRAEQEARAFIAQLSGKWVDGPLLQHRTVTYSPWESVTESGVLGGEEHR